LALFLLVLKLALVKDFDHWSVLALRDDDQIEFSFFSHPQRIAGINDATVVVFLVNKQDLGRPDLAIDQILLCDSSVL